MMHPPILFFAIGFPLTDLRPLLPDDACRLPEPRWPRPRVGSFVHSAGGVRERRPTGIEEWDGEDVYCGAQGALRFDNFLSTRTLGGELRPFCAFRRILSDGCVMRLEVGFRLLADHDRPPYLSAGRVFTLLQECAQLPVKIRGKDGRWRVHKLADAGPPLAAHLLRATTRKVDGEIPPLQSWWMTAGRPILIFEACPRDLLELPPGSVAVEADRGSDFLLAYHSLQGTGNRPTAGVWFLEYDPGAELDRLRRLRIHLFRLHAEREALWKLLQELGTGGRLAFDRRSPSSWDLKCRLEKAARRLDQPRRFGLDQASILDCPGYKLNFIDEPSRAAMLRSLNDVAGRLELAGAPAHSA